MKVINFIKNMAFNYWMTIIVVFIVLHKRRLIDLPATEQTINTLEMSAYIIFAFFWALKTLEISTKIDDQQTLPSVWAIINLGFICIVASFATIS
jgi:hypothetical protein